MFFYWYWLRAAGLTSLRTRSQVSLSKSEKSTKRLLSSSLHTAYARSSRLSSVVANVMLKQDSMLIEMKLSRTRCYQYLKGHSFKKFVFTHRVKFVYAHVIAEPEALIASRARDHVRSAFKSRLVCAH